MSAMLPLVAKGATLKRRGRVLVGPVDLTLSGAGVTIVIGPNGSGKTSLLRMLHGIERLSAGSVDWACDTAEARQRQGFVFQSPILMRRTVRDNIAYPLMLDRVAKRDARDQADTWARAVGLGEALSRPARALSGGERQKLAIARALIRNPDVLFLDEPCAALDGRATREIESILHDAVLRGTRVIMSTHDMGQARRLAGEVIFMLNGHLHDRARAPDFFKQPNTQAARAFLRGDIVE